MDDLCLGKLPARADAVKLSFSAYLAGTKAFPQVPNDFGHEEFTPAIEWGMLGNNRFGNCVVAGGAHETMLFNRMAGKVVTFTDSTVCSDFQAINGYPCNPFLGTDMQKAASYRLKTGLIDAAGHRHRIGAYLKLRPGDLRELYLAMYLFSVVGVGVQCPTSARTQFAQHKAWSVVSGAVIEAGHYVPCVALRSNIVCVTWGKFQAMRPSFYAHFCDEAIAYVSPEALVNGKSPEGFDYASLIADLNALNG